MCAKKIINNLNIIGGTNFRWDSGRIGFTNLVNV